MTKRKNRSYTDEFRREAVALITEQGYSVSKAAASLGVTDKLLYNWKAKNVSHQIPYSASSFLFPACLLF